MIEKIRTNKFLLIKILVMAVFPLLCVTGICLIHGKSLTSIYIPCSEWNDEMVYYKLTESVLDYGIPQGYFGFNESHGIYLSFASWSPVLLLPWVLWGKIFGWNILSPIICNIALLSITLCIITIMHKPDWKQIAAILVCFMCCSHFSRFIFSCMSEVIVWSLALLVASLFIYDVRKESNKAIFISLFLLALLCLMRPYFIIFFFYPIIRLKSSGKRLVFIAIMTLIITMISYYLINHYLSAPYLDDLYYTDWISSFENGLFFGIKYLFNRIIKSFISIVKFIGRCMTGTDTAGGLYCAFFVSFIIQFIHLLLILKQKEKKLILLDIQILLAALLFFVAILLMYRLPEGGRHVLSYVFIIILNISINKINDKHLLWQTLILGVLFCYLFYFRALSEFDFKLPFVDEAVKDELHTLNSELNQKIVVSEDNSPSYDNTIIWIFSDEVDGVDTRMDFRQFYATPSGIGINLCLGRYVLENIDGIHSKYIGTVPNGKIDKLLSNSGKEVLVQNDNIIVYQLY